MTNRTRSRTFYSRTGYYQLNRYLIGSCAKSTAGNSVDISINVGSQVCNDHISSKPYYDGPLDITYSRINPPRVNGVIPRKCDNGTFSGPVHNYYLAQLWNPANIPALPALAVGYYTNKALANANPNAPKIDLLAEIFELKDFPGMLRDLGRVLARRVRPSDVPGGYLAYRFGWAPLFSDLYTLLHLAEAIEARKKELLAAAQGSGNRLSRTIARNTGSVGLFGNAEFFNTVGPNSQLFATAGWILDYYEKWWYTARQKLISPLHAKTLDTDALWSVLGLDLSAATLWEELPWSWLIDYFVNVGDALSINRGWLKFKIDRLNVMCSQYIEGSINVKYVAEGLSIVPGQLVKSRKYRTQPLPVPQLIAFRPYLPASSRKIVGSLVTSRALRKFRL